MRPSPAVQRRHRAPGGRGGPLAVLPVGGVRAARAAQGGRAARAAHAARAGRHARAGRRLHRRQGITTLLLEDGELACRSPVGRDHRLYIDDLLQILKHTSWCCTSRCQ